MRLLKQKEFKNFLSILINVRDDNIIFAQRTKSVIDGLMEHIELELQSRKH